MKSNYFTLEIKFLLILSIIPWPGPSVFKIICPREDARIVRKTIENKWISVLDKYNVKLPLECPFHPSRDIFWPQESAKRKKHYSRSSSKSTSWTCNLCGETFQYEKHLDLHFDKKHKHHINMAEDAVCLADFCDIIRCDVLRSQDIKFEYSSESRNTDVEIWRESTTTRAYKTELVSINSNREGGKGRGKGDVAKYDNNNNNSNNSKKKLKENICREKCRNNSDVCSNDDMVDSALPAIENKQKTILAQLQKLKANCKPEELQKLKNKCEILVRDCIGSLLIYLSVKDFKEVEDELNKAICWYLTCDRYWEDSQSDAKQFPWGLWFVLFMVLSLGISLCYYVIWVLYDADDLSVTSASITDRSTPSPTHLLRQDPQFSGDGQNQIYTEDYFTPEKDNEYIYVTYPPDLKRRLLQSCYNRTTRL